jgi:predicted enzyme related to lactoylglutathione lyase
MRARIVTYMPNVIHFEIGVDDLEGAVSFYSKVFDWRIEKAEDNSDYWYITTGDEDDPGITGGLGSRFDEWNPTVNTIEVPSLDICAQKIAAASGKVLAPKFPIPGMGYMQYCHDPEGNAFGIMEYDESAQ